MPPTSELNTEEPNPEEVRYCAATKANGEPCPLAAKPGSDFCGPHSVHEAKKATVAEIQSLGVDPAAQRQAALLATADEPILSVSDTEAADYFSPTGQDDEPDAAPAEAGHAAPDPDIAPGMVRRYVYDPATDDYVLQEVPQEDTSVIVRDPTVFHDAFELGDAYRSGDAARFDYRWCNADEKRNLTERTHGFVPVRKALDTQYRTNTTGAVANGDLVLMRRPKEITEQRAREMHLHHERLMGETIDDFHAQGRREGVETFGGVGETEAEALRAPHRPVPAPERPRGARSFAFPNNPLGRDKVAERHGSVGG